MEKAKILVVEDEKIVAYDIQHTLKELGYDVLAMASSGEEAIEKTGKTYPDLVLMDIRLKGAMDGIEAAEQIRERFNIPVVYLSAHADDSTLQRAVATQSYGYILKPFKEKELQTTIETALYKHKMERGLRQRVDTILKSIGDAVIATDKKGLVTFMNPAAEGLTGWEEDKALGKSLKEVVRIKDDERPNLMIARNGRETPIDCSITSIRDDHGNITGEVLILRDISERVMAEEELLRASKLESVGILAGGIAHDFNNILTSILGNISLMKISVNTKEETSKILTEVERASLRAKGLTEQLLTFSKGGAPVKKTASIAEIIKDTTNFALRGSNVRPQFLVPDNVWSVEVDGGQMSQVINNLVINAQHSMPGGGTIKIQVENIVLGIGRMDGIPLPDGEYVKITLEDQGFGIPWENTTKIFDPYFTTKQEGSGLGLAIVYSIVKNHSGYISVESKLEVGTTFNLYLPTSAREIEFKEEVEERLPMGKGRVLVMDDEEPIRELIDRILTYSGYKVEFAKDGGEALEAYKRAQESGQPFEAVIIDLTIPGGMGGVEAIAKLLELDPEVKAIVSSGYFNDPILTDYKKYGFSAVVTKPYRVAELSSVVNEVINAN